MESSTSMPFKPRQAISACPTGGHVGDKSTCSAPTLSHIRISTKRCRGKPASSPQEG
jgi:hypothetical protein